MSGSFVPPMRGNPQSIPFGLTQYRVAAARRRSPPIATSVSVIEGQSETTRCGGTEPV